MDEVLLNYERASHTVTGSESSIYIGAIQAHQSNTPSIRSRTAIDLCTVISVVVPLPSTVWLFASVLLSLLSINYKKSER